MGYNEIAAVINTAFATHITIILSIVLLKPLNLLLLYFINFFFIMSHLSVVFCIMFMITYNLFIIIYVIVLFFKIFSYINFANCKLTKNEKIKINYYIYTAVFCVIAVNLVK